MGKRVAVLGGGITGVVGARMLARSGMDVTIFEAASTLGGLQRSHRFDGLTFDIGPFSLSRPTIERVFPEVVQELTPVRFSYAVIWPRMIAGAFPPSPGWFIRSFGAIETLRVGFSLAVTRTRPDGAADLDDYLSAVAGRYAYEHYGIRRYVERLFRTSFCEIDIAFARQRLSWVSQRYSFRKIAASSLPRFARPAGKPPPLPNFTRPAQGFQAMYDTIFRVLTKEGVGVRLGTPVRSLRGASGAWTLNSASGDEHYDEVFSTLPIPIMQRILGHASVFSGRTMTLVTALYDFDAGAYEGPPIIYNLSDEGAWKRIFVQSSVYGPTDGRGYLTVETTIPPGADAETAKSEAVADFEAFRRRNSHLFPASMRYLTAVLTPNAYPILTKEAVAALPRAVTALADAGIVSAGRQGDFAFVSSLKAVAMSEAAAARLIDESRAGRLTS